MHGTPAALCPQVPGLGLPGLDGAARPGGRPSASGLRRRGAKHDMRRARSLSRLLSAGIEMLLGGAARDGGSGHSGGSGGSAAAAASCGGFGGVRDSSGGGGAAAAELGERGPRLGAAAVGGVPSNGMVQLPSIRTHVGQR